MNSKYLSDIGKMDRILTLRKKTVATFDRFGHPATFTNVDSTVYGALSFDKSLKTDEQGEHTKQLKSDILFFIIRYKSDLAITDEVIYSGRTYDIINIEEIGRMKFQKIKIQINQ